MEEKRIRTPAALAWVYKRPRLSFSLKVLSHLISSYAIFVFALLSFSYARLGLLPLIKEFFVLGVPFFAVSVLRRLLDLPRPYEVYDIYTVPPKNRCGHSFPSRHAFSAFLIGVASLEVLPMLSLVLLALGVILCACRILTGVHFVRDCAAGALSGALCGAIALLFL